MTKLEASKLRYIVLILENILCSHCKHIDEDGIRNSKVCTNCIHYTASKFEFKEE